MKRVGALSLSLFRMYPRLSSSPTKGERFDVYVFCAPQSWRKNMRTLFYALTRGRNYGEDGDIRTAQKIGAEIAGSLMLCDINTVIDVLRSIRDAINGLNPSVAVTVSPACCPPNYGEPGLPPPSPPPPPSDTPPPGDVPINIVYCRAARALARNMRAILQDLSDLVLLHALTPMELYRTLTRIGIEQQTALFISITAGLLSFVYRVLSELLYNVPGSALQALSEELLAVSDAIDDEFFTCCFAPGSELREVVECCKQKLDELELGLVMSQLVKSLVYEEKLLHYITGKARDADGNLVDINWEETGISQEPCCEDEGPYVRRRPTSELVVRSLSCTYVYNAETGWYNVVGSGWVDFKVRRTYTAAEDVVATVIELQNCQVLVEGEIREDVPDIPGRCHTFVGIQPWEGSKMLVSYRQNQPGLVEYLQRVYPNAYIVPTAELCNAERMRDIVAQVRYRIATFDVRFMYVVRQE